MISAESLPSKSAVIYGRVQLINISGPALSTPPNDRDRFQTCRDSDFVPKDSADCYQTHFRSVARHRSSCRAFLHQFQQFVLPILWVDFYLFYFSKIESLIWLEIGINRHFCTKFSFFFNISGIDVSGNNFH